MGFKPGSRSGTVNTRSLDMGIEVNISSTSILQLNSRKQSSSFIDDNIDFNFSTLLSLTSVKVRKWRCEKSFNEKCSRNALIWPHICLFDSFNE